MEVMQFGPTAPGTASAAQDLRDNIYSWPLVSRCAVEEEHRRPRLRVARASRPSLVTNRRGLGALEYLLFYEGADTACRATLPRGRRRGRRFGHGEATRASAPTRSPRPTTCAARAVALVAAWDPAKGDFVADAGDGRPGNPSTRRRRTALNAVSDALFYIEREVKDMKLAQPLGLDDGLRERDRARSCASRCSPAARRRTCAPTPRASAPGRGVRPGLFRAWRSTTCWTAVGRRHCRPKLLRTRAAAVRPASTRSRSPICVRRWPRTRPRCARCLRRAQGRHRLAQDRVRHRARPRAAAGARGRQ